MGLAQSAARPQAARSDMIRLRKQQPAGTVAAPPDRWSRRRRRLQERRPLAATARSTLTAAGTAGERLQPRDELTLQPLDPTLQPAEAPQPLRRRNICAWPSLAMPRPIVAAVNKTRNRFMGNSWGKGEGRNREWEIGTRKWEIGTRDRGIGNQKRRHFFVFFAAIPPVFVRSGSSEFPFPISFQFTPSFPALAPRSCWLPRSWPACSAP